MFQDIQNSLSQAWLQLRGFLGLSEGLDGLSLAIGICVATPIFMWLLRASADNAQTFEVSRSLQARQRHLRTKASVGAGSDVGWYVKFISNAAFLSAFGFGAAMLGLFSFVPNIVSGPAVNHGTRPAGVSQATMPSTRQLNVLDLGAVQAVTDCSAFGRGVFSCNIKTDLHLIADIDMKRSFGDRFPKPGDRLSVTRSTRGDRQEVHHCLNDVCRLVTECSRGGFAYIFGGSDCFIDPTDPKAGSPVPAVAGKAP